MKNLNEYLIINESKQGNLKPRNREELGDLIMQRIE